MIDHDTICAISTPRGTGGIAVIRVSGKNALPLTELIFQPIKKSKKLVDQLGYTLHYGSFVVEEEVIDEVIVALFRAPNSFTGEDCIEISCHGSIYIQQRILEALVGTGMRLARPGEFTQRAFLNGKIDLSQAEAVADLISASGRAAHKMAMSQMRGGFSREIDRLREDLLKFSALIELELDFSEEDVEFADRTELVQLVEKIERVISRLLRSFRLGNVIKNGIPVAIVGETNVGKSTLLNALLNDDKAIVSDIHGTTRDVIEDVINIDGILFRFSDTAGLRETQDVIETIGIERSYAQIQKAEIVLLVIDCSDGIDKIAKRLQLVRQRLSDQYLIVVANKMDRIGAEDQERLSRLVLTERESMVFTSARERINLEELIDKMKHTLDLNGVEQDDVIVSNIRHHEALQGAMQSLERVKEGLYGGIPGDFLAQDIRECLHYLGEITGKISTDEILGHIFKNFCIGK